MKASVENKILTGFAASLLALAGMGWLSYRTMTDSIAAQGWVTHTREVISDLETVLATLTAAETEQRGYLLTGGPKFLADCQTAVRQLPGQLARLRQITADNPAQQQELDRLEPLVRQRLALLDERSALFQESGLQAATQKPVMEGGQVVMNDIRASIGKMRSTEERLLADRQQRSRDSMRLSSVVIIAGGALAVAIGVVAILLIHRDLKLRARTEMELQTTKAQLQAILDNTPAMVFLKDKAGRYLFVNRRFAQLAGRSEEEIIGKDGFELFKHELAEAARVHDRQVLTSGRPMEFEETILYPDGPHTHLAVKFPLCDASGKIFATGGVSSDISERKRTEQMRDDLDRFFAVSLDFLCIANADGYFKRVSPAVTDILGWSVEEFLSRPFISFVHPDDRAATLREVERQVVAGEKVFQFENRYQRKDGSWRVLSWRSIPQPDGLMYATARDVTEQKRAEEEIMRQKRELEATNQELEAFSYSVSHDLRAPLRHIDGFVGLLAKQAAGKLDDRSRRYLGIIADSARRMGALIDDLLVFSRMGRAELHRIKVSPDSLIHETVDALQGEMNGRRIVWKIGALPEVEADPTMLRQVWANLIGNAVKYTRPRDPAEIEIGCNDDNGEFVFHIRDNGVGFDMQYTHKLFGVFQRLHRSEDFEGTGIGLANVQRIVHRHGGRVWAEGKLDGGATFFFSLPKTQSQLKDNHHGPFQTHPAG
jgi:PAS domain S-box-containing protein